MADGGQHEATTELNEALAAGFEAGNFDGLAPFYTEASSLMPPRGKALEGRAAICAFWLGVRNKFTGIAFTTTKVRSLGETICRETGTYMMSADATSANGGPAAAPQGKYLFVWELVDGEWQIESSIWNRNAEAGGAGRQQGRGRGQGGGQAGGPGQGRQGGGGGRPPFQGGRQGSGGQGRGQGQGGQGQGNLYEGSAGLYSSPKD